MKIRNVLCATFILCAIMLTTFIIYNNKSYSYGIIKQISGNAGNRIIEYSDTETDAIISFDDAYKYFGVPVYEELYDNGSVIYFGYGKEISHQEYIKGLEKEKADNLASLYGVNAYRVHTTEEFIHAFDDIYQNLKIGEFHIVFSKYEAIDFNRVESYYKEKYGVTNFKQNYYSYQVKGMWEPDRFGIDINQAANTNELILTTTNIRLSGNERVVVEDFVNKLLPYLSPNGSDYEKILAAYTYIINTSTYLTDNGFINDLLASNTSVYDALISRKTTCIGYSIAFSYLMDKLGIESYIIDQVTEANEEAHVFSSVHTYNMVKFNNKFYKVDLTGNVFLGSLSQSELYNESVNISTTSYNGNKNITIDYNSINNILNASKSIKTTTTNKVEATTTTKVYSYSIPNGTKKTNKGSTNTTQENRTSPKKTTVITTEDASGNIVEIPVEIDDDGSIKTTPSGEYIEATEKVISTTKNHEEKEEKKHNKINYNYILFPLLFMGIITLIILKLKDMGKISLNSAKAKDILEKDIKENGRE